MAEEKGDGSEAFENELLEQVAWKKRMSQAHSRAASDIQNGQAQAVQGTRPLGRSCKVLAKCKSLRYESSNSDGSSIIEEDLLASGPRSTVPPNVNDHLFLIGA